MKKENKIVKGKKAGVRLGLVVGLVIAMFLVYATFPTPELVMDEETEQWNIVFKGSIAEAAESNPGAGASGFLEIFFTNHSGSPATAYSENTSATLESWCVANMPGKTPYASADSYNLELDHSVAFDIVVKVRFNKTHAWNGSAFIDGDTRVNITFSGGGVVIADVTGTNVVVRNDTSDQFIWVNVYWAAGAGYDLDKSGTSTNSEISIEARY